MSKKTPILEDGHMMAPKTHVEPPRSRTLQLLATLLPILARLHVVVYRRTGGAIGQRIFGTRVLLLSTTGHKTGQPRTTPVAYLTAGQATVIIGGAAGAARHPGWWLNLQAEPLAQVQIGRQRLRVSATLATREEREHLWAHYPAQRTLFDA